ncbi:Pdc2 protein [Saccharomycopsis crataegensis]|uniref:Pdc2 protein n=1 Tax=Saccharomycopsis crataegensis TaxID=43959 RepID=A0AAV5QVL6_9ASCO|nr:Pdc2 protein [Saccharomycopsis crataegensis]
MSMGNIQKMGYTIRQKIDICLMAEANPEMTQADLANWAKKKYHTIKPPSQTTISRILSKKNELIALKEHEFKLIRRRKPSNVLLREILTEWISQSVWDGIPITIPIIQNSATTLWKILPVNSKEGNGEFSHKWCNHFLGKMNVNLSNLDNELVKPSKIWNLATERLQLKSYLKSFNLKDIFVLDDFFLYYKLPLDQKYVKDEYYHDPANATTNDSRILQNKNGVTVLLTTNADGSEKLEPLLIGHYQNMVCFEGKPITKITKKYELSYKTNKKAWLTSIQLSDWLSTLDKRLSIAGRDIVLILDDAPSHRVVNMKLDFIKLVFVHNPNIDNKAALVDTNLLTSQRQRFLPMDLGIFREFKILYRLQQYLLSISLQSKLRPPSKILELDQHSISLVDVMIMIKNAWSNVSVEIIRNSFINTDIIDLEEYTKQQFDGSGDDKITNIGNHKSYWGDSINDASDSNDSEGNTHSAASLSQNTATDFKNSEYKLMQIIKKLNVHEPWEIDMLTNLGVEDKFLSYQTPTEMVDACIVEEYEPNNNNTKGSTRNGSERSKLLKKDSKPVVNAAGFVDQRQINNPPPPPPAAAAQVDPVPEPQPPVKDNDVDDIMIKDLNFGNSKNDPIMESYDSYLSNWVPESNDFKFNFDSDQGNAADFNLFNYGDDKPVFDLATLDTANNLYGFNASKDANFGFQGLPSHVDPPSVSLNPATAPQYNQHVNRYTANSLYSDPIKKGNMSSIITIPDNSRSFGVLYSKKRKVSSLENDNPNPPSLFSSPRNPESLGKSDSFNSASNYPVGGPFNNSKNSSTVSSPQNFSDINKPSSELTPRNPLSQMTSHTSFGTTTTGDYSNINNGTLSMTPQGKASLLLAVVNAANNGEFRLSESCINELVSQLYNQVSIVQQQTDQNPQMMGSGGNDGNMDLSGLSQYLAQSLELSGGNHAYANSATSINNNNINNNNINNNNNNGNNINDNSSSGMNF